MQFRNQYGEIVTVTNLKMRDGRIFFQVRGKGCGQKFLNRNTCLVLDEHVADGSYLKVADGWELAETPKQRKPRAAKVTEPEPQPQPTAEPQPQPVQPTQSEPEPTKSKARNAAFKQYAEFKKQHPYAIILMAAGDFYETYNEDASTVAAVCDLTLTENRDGKLCGFPKHALDTYLAKLIRAGHRVAICDDNKVIETVQKSEPQPEPTQKVDPSIIKDELIAKYGAMGADIFDSALKLAGYVPQTAAVDEQQVRDIVSSELKKAVKPTAITVTSPNGAFTVNGMTHKDSKKFCALVNAGKPLYMYGPAGCGKSFTAKQIAEALHLDYYETSQAMFAHELKGYGDAGGKYVETAFYKAFTKGGIFFLDEVDASAPEALVVLNNAIANGRFDFPVIGNVEAHPKFRVISAGNTRMTGATLQYTARQMQDTSFKNRFFFAMTTYDRDIFLAIAGNDEEIVNFGADLRRAARETGISQLFSYRQGKDLATLVECCDGDDAYLLRGSVLQEKEVDDVINLYEHLSNKTNRWACAMHKCIEQMKEEVVW